MPASAAPPSRQQTGRGTASPCRSRQERCLAGTASRLSHDALLISSVQATPAIDDCLVGPIGGTRCVGPGVAASNQISQVT